jgi:hypothetical protein
LPPAVTDRLGIETSGHNTVDEVVRFGEALKKVVA